MRSLRHLSESALFARVTDARLKSIVESAAEQSADLLGTVVRDMPLFTLHNERHILNVIGWMETLLTPAGIASLGQLECSPCILAAYTPALGMTLAPAEREALPADPDYLRHRDRFLEERHLIDRLRAEDDHARRR